MKVALIQPPSEFLISQSVHPPLGLMYISSALKAKGVETVLCDLGLGDEIPEADVHCVTGTTPQLGAMLRIIADLYADQKLVIAGGPHATCDPQPLLDAGASVVVQGEGEDAIFDALKLVLNAATPDYIYNSHVIRAPRIKDLDALPFPDRSRAREYHYEIMDHKGNKHAATTMITARGCPNRCSFCSKAVWGNAVRLRSAANVLAELRQLKDLGWDAVHLFDDTICVSKRRLLKICVGIRQLGLAAWRAFVRADEMSPELFQAMADANCAEVGIGVESGSQRILDAVHKSETVEQQKAAIKWAKAAGLRCKTFVILGLPGEDWSTIQETIDFLAATEPDDIDASVLSIMSGSAIHADPSSFGLQVLGAPVAYKGKPNEYACAHRTASLSPEQILAARAFVEARFKKG